MLLANYFLGRFNREFARNIRGFTEAPEPSQPTRGRAISANWKTA